MQAFFSAIDKEGKAFLNSVVNGNELYYFSLLFLYVTSIMMYMIRWKPELSAAVRFVHFLLFMAVMWGSAIYLFSVLAEWRNAWNRTGELIGIGVLVFALAGIISKLVNIDSYAFVMGAFFCVMAGGKNYKKIIFMYLFILLSSLLIGFIGLKAGFTFDVAKPYRAYGGHSLGICYPNNWGFLVFAAMMILWYFFLLKKRIITLMLFWGMAIFMYKYITCMTIGAMAFLFPVVGFISEIAQDRSSKIKKQNKLLDRIIIWMPFIFLAVMLLGCWQMDWMHDTFYKTKLESLAMRFVEGGYALRNNGVTLFGQPFRQWDKSIVEYSTEIWMIIDSAFISYLILRGVVAMLIILGWIAFANQRCLKEKDYRLLAISFFMLLFSTMERPGLDAWYNFVLLYPLAALEKHAEEAGLTETAV